MPRPTIAPTGLKVELTATTALLKWKGVGPVESYEINVAEGARLGSVWIPTHSRHPRFLKRGLKRGTQHTYSVRARNADGVGPASPPVRFTTPIASLHNTLFFKRSVNSLDDLVRVKAYSNSSTSIPEVADNNYETFSKVKDYNINTSLNNKPTRVDAFFVISKGVARHSGTPTGGSGSGWRNVPIPASVRNWEGTEVSTTVDGFQHHLFLLGSHFTAKSVRVQFVGTNVEIYELQLLEFGIEIDANSDFTDIEPDFVDRAGVVHPLPGGRIEHSEPIGNAREKWEVTYTVKVIPGQTALESVDNFLRWRQRNRNHFHFQEWTRYPGRGYPATFVDKRVPVRLRSDNKTLGDVVTFKIAEQ